MDGRRLLVIANWRDQTHPDAGGAEVVCERLAKGFATRGHDVVLLTAAVRGECRRERVDGYRVVRQGGRFTVYAWTLLWLLIHRRRISGVIDSQNGIPFFTPLAVRRDTPVLMLLHHVHQDQFSLYFSPVVAGVGRWLERQGTRLVYRDRTVMAVSPSTREGARRSLGLRGDIVVVTPGAESVHLPLPGRRSRAEHPRIVCVGRLVPHKCTSAIVEAVPALLAEFPTLELHLIGDGLERTALEEQVARLGLAGHVTVHGPVSAADRDRLMRSAWMSVSASKGEGWGLSVVEANALGVPVLAYRRPGLRDSIRDGETGWLIAEDDELGAAIGDALREMGDEEAAEAMGARARQWAARFTWDRMAEQVLALLLAEEGRLGKLPSNRRASTDLATVVRVPADLLPFGRRLEFRDTDECMMGDADLVVLLRNTDTDTAKVALHRVGLTTAVDIEERVRVSVARPIDLVSPAVSASPAAVRVAPVLARPEELHPDSQAG